MEEPRWILPISKNYAITVSKNPIKWAIIIISALIFSLLIENGII